MRSAQDFNIPITFGPQGAVGVRVPMSYLCWWLGQQLQNDQRPVVDETGLDKNYDFTLSYQPVLPPGAQPAGDLSRPRCRDRPSLFECAAAATGAEAAGTGRARWITTSSTTLSGLRQTRAIPSTMDVVATERITQQNTVPGARPARHTSQTRRKRQRRYSGRCSTRLRRRITGRTMCCHLGIDRYW